MMSQPIHILNQMGVITSFSVAKKVTEEEITKFFTKGKRSGRTEAEIEQLLRDKIVNEIQEAVADQKIPGLLSTQDLAKELGLNKVVVDNMPELNRLIMVIAHKLSEKKYDKMSLCYLINSLVNILGLNERDFQQFHKQSGVDNADSDGDDGDDDDGDEFPPDED
jgi:hypothetical protein